MSSLYFTDHTFLGRVVPSWTLESNSTREPGDRRLRRSAAPIRDPVPLVDKHTGLVQHTGCNESSALLCHLPQLMVCDLLQRCGDAGNRRFRGCTFASIAGGLGGGAES